MYTLVSIFLDHRLKIADYGLYSPFVQRTFKTNDVRNQLTMKIGVPKQFPIFKEMKYALDPFYFTVSDRLLGHKFGLGYEVRSPGCFREKHGDLLPILPPFISRVCSGFGPCRGGLQTRLA